MIIMIVLACVSSYAAFVMCGEVAPYLVGKRERL